MLKFSSGHLFIFLLLLSTISLFAQVPEGGTMLNAEGTYSSNGSCTATSIAVSDQEFTKAIRVVVGTNVSNTWDAQLSFPPVGGVAEGDVVLVAFYARTTSSEEETGEGSLNVIIEKKVSYEKQLSTNVLIGAEWKEYFARARMTTTWAQSELSLLFHMGFPSQTVEVADVRFLNYQTSLDLEDLPETKVTYVGQDPDAAWRAPALERINQIRKGGASIMVYDENGEPVEGAQLHVEMAKHQFGFGTAIVASEFNDNATYRNKVLDVFNEVVFENDLKWPDFINTSTRPAILRALDTLDIHGIPARGHNVIWPSYRFTPDLVEELKDDPGALRAAIDDHIDEVVGFTKGRLNDWDVINEPFSEHDIQDILGDEVMADWFKRTRRIDRGVKLYLNEYTILSGSGTNKVKQDYYYGLIQDIEAWGGEINGIGMQGHFGTDLTSIFRVYDILERFAELEKEIKITEFDINTTQREVQAAYTRDFMTMVFSHPSVKSILVWGFWANRHWKPESAFYASDWSIRPHGEVWNEMIREEWWTPGADLVSDANGELFLEGFLGDYAYTLSYGDVERTGTFSLENSFQSGLDNEVDLFLDDALPESVEITPSELGYICAGEQITLQAPVGEGLDYLWQRNGETLTQQESAIVVGDSGAYTVTISKNGISLTSQPYDLDVREAPVSQMLVDGELDFCDGGDVTFSVSEASGDDFDWYLDGSRIQWGDSTLTAGVQGSYEVEVINDGCSSRSEPIELIVRSTPNASVISYGESTFCSGESIRLQAKLQPGVTYNWYSGDELLEETSHNLTVTETGAYSLLTSNEHCSNTSSTFNIVVLDPTDPQCTVGIEEALLDARVFPNPFHGSLQVELRGSAGEHSVLELYDAVGNLLLLKRAEAGTNLVTLSVPDPGLYMLRIIRGEDIQIHKLINH